MIGLNSLKRSYQHDDDPNAYEEGPPDDYVPPRRGQPGYIHEVYYDPKRFSSEDDCADLLMQHEAERPELRWSLRPTTIEKLPILMAGCGVNHADQFRRHGYVSELVPLKTRRGSPKRGALSQQAWNAFLANAVLADAITYAWKKIENQELEAEGFEKFDFAVGKIFFDLKGDALDPVLGKANKQTRAFGTNILVEHRGLYLAPRTFRRPCIAHPATPITWNTGAGKGRGADPFSQFTSDGRELIRSRVRFELDGWSDHLGADFSIDGVVLWIAQTLALLRVEAAEWKFREKPGYTTSGMAKSRRHKYAQDTKEQFASEDLGEIANDLRRSLKGRAGTFVPTIERPIWNPTLDVLSILAGGIGLQSESHLRLLERSFIYRSSTAYSRALCSLAGWINTLKRFHRVHLDTRVATIIHEVMQGERTEVAEFDLGASKWSAKDVIRAQFPDDIWNALLEAAKRLKQADQKILVNYRWNDNPTAPPAPERAGNNIAIVGPLLPINRQMHQWWADKALLFRGRESLTI